MIIDYLKKIKCVKSYYAVFKLHNHIIFNKINRMILQILVPKVSIRTRSVKRDTLVHIAMPVIHILRYTDIKSLDWVIRHVFLKKK